MADSIHGDVEFFCLSSQSLRGLKVEPYKRLLKFVEDTPPDIVLAHRYKSLFISLLLNFRKEVGAVIGVAHEFGLLNQFFRSFFSKFWKKNVHLIGVSQPLCADLLSKHPHLEGRVHYLHNSVEVSALHGRSFSRQQLNIPPNSYCYGTIGRLVRKKDHKLLLESFASIEGNSFLAIVGDGNLLPELKLVADKLGVKERVIFCGEKNEARLLIQAFDAFVFPSTREEAFGLVLLEAMFARVPIVCSDAPGPASVLGENGMLFECGNMEALTTQLKAVGELTKSESDLMTEKAFERVVSLFSRPSMERKIRSFSCVKEHAPPTE